jgi:Ras-related protein Rab-4B
VLLVYDIGNRESFDKLQAFLEDVKSLTTRDVSIIVVGNKIDLKGKGDPTTMVSEKEAMDFCARNGDLPLILTSALTGENVDEAFERLASMILTKVELGIIDPDNVDSGVQYGEVPRWDNTVPRGSRTLASLIGGTRSGRRRQGALNYNCC